MSDPAARRTRRAAPTARYKAKRGESLRQFAAARAAAVGHGWPSLIAGVGACLALIKLGFDSGGYFPADSLPAAAFCFLVLGVLLAIRPPRFTLSTTAIVALIALTGLALWTGVSSTWSLAPDSGFEDFQRTLFYLGLFGLALYAAASGRYSRMLLWGALTVCAVIGCVALMSRLFPDIVPSDESALADYRLSYPLTYWNAVGAMAAMGALLSLGLASNPRSLPWSRGIAAALAVLLVTTMQLTLSRASWLALIVGVGVLVLLGAHRGALLITGTIVGVAAALAILRLQMYDALVDSPTAGDGQGSEGAQFAGQLAVLAGGAGVLIAMLAAGRRSVMVNDLVERARRPVTLAVAGVAVLLACIVYATSSTTVEGRSARGIDRAENWVERQWDEFMAPSSYVASGTERLTSASGTRSELYRVAIDGFEDNPLFGSGAGSFEVLWYRNRRVDEDVRDAHSLDLEVLSELGLVGALLLVGLVGSFGVAIVRTRHKGGAVTRSEAAAAGAACCVWVIHSFVDWDWQMPAVSGVTLLIAAAVLPEGRRPGQVRHRRSAAIARAR